MKISIAQRLRPFSHLPGTYCVLPGSVLRFRIFPTRIEVHDISGSLPVEMVCLDLSLTGPVKDFTVMQDMEKGLLRIWGHFKEGFLRYSIVPGSNVSSFILEIEKCSSEGIFSDSLSRKFSEGETVPFPSLASVLPQSDLGGCCLGKERLSLGCHKSQDWDFVRRRSSLSEILPFWHRIGKCVPCIPLSSWEGTLGLLQKCSAAASENRKLEVGPLLESAFHASFSGILSPSLEDHFHQGFHIPSLTEAFSGSPLSLLEEGGKLISSLFIQHDANQVSFLPLLLPEFHCGRYTNIECQSFGEFDMEWSKKTIRRVVFRSTATRSCHFTFQKELRSFRIRTSSSDKGRRMSVEESLDVETGKVYFLDNFQK